MLVDAPTLRSYVLDLLKDGRALGNADMPKAATPYTVKRTMSQLVDERKIVTRLLPGGKTRLFFKDNKVATQYLRDYASNLTPKMGTIKFDTDASIEALPEPTVYQSAPYHKLTRGITESGYVASV